MKKLILTLFVYSINFQLFSQSFEWALNTGGETVEDRPSRLAIDGLGNIYTVGEFESNVDFDPSDETFLLAPAGPKAAFLTKTTSEGEFIFAKMFTGFGGYSSIQSIKIDQDNNIYVIGTFAGTIDFDPSEDVVNLTSSYADIFVLKLNSDGNFLFVRQFGGLNHDYGHDLLVDDSQKIYVLATFKGSADFDPSESIYNLTSNGDRDIAITKLDETGEFIYCKQIGGAGSDFSPSISKDSFNNIYIFGSFENSVDFDPGEEVYELNALYQGGFILKLNEAGEFVFAKKIDGGNVQAQQMKLDNLDNIIIIGHFQGVVDFNPEAETFYLTSTEVYPFGSPFIAKYNKDGVIDFAITFDASLVFLLNSMTIDENENIIITGALADSVDFNPGPEENYLIHPYETWEDGQSVFICKLDGGGNFLSVQGQTGISEGITIVSDPFNNLYLAGTFSNTIDFDASDDIFELSPSGPVSMFLLKLGQYVLGNPSEQQNIQLLAYPNPNLGSVMIELDNTYKDITLIIQNNLGEQVYTERFSEVKNIGVDLPLAAGVYYISLKNGDHLLFGTKLIKQN